LFFSENSTLLLSNRWNFSRGNPLKFPLKIMKVYNELILMNLFDYIFCYFMVVKSFSYDSIYSSINASYFNKMSPMFYAFFDFFISSVKNI